MTRQDRIYDLKLYVANNMTKKGYKYFCEKWEEIETEHPPRCPDCERRLRRGRCMESHFNKHGDETMGDD